MWGRAQRNAGAALTVLGLRGGAGRRREGYEFAVGPPTVITKEIEGKKCEPFEEALVEVPQEHMGQVVDLLGQRKGQMLEMGPASGEGATQRVKYRIPTRGLLVRPLAPASPPPLPAPLIPIPCLPCITSAASRCSGTARKQACRKATSCRILRQWLRSLLSCREGVGVWSRAGSALAVPSSSEPGSPFRGVACV